MIEDVVVNIEKGELLRDFDFDKNGKKQGSLLSLLDFYNYFQEQMKRQFRKPLVVFNSKKLLRYKPATSELNEFALGLRFQRVIGEQKSETLVAPEQIKEVVVCSGQAYYEVLETRQQLNITDYAIIRVEQIAPFPYENFKALVQQYPNAKFTWFQEEHQNMGAWTTSRTQQRRP